MKRRQESVLYCTLCTCLAVKVSPQEASMPWGQVRFRNLIYNCISSLKEGDGICWQIGGCWIGGLIGLLVCWTVGGCWI